MLKKPVFDCSKLGDFYDCGCEEDDDPDGEKKASSKTTVSMPKDESKPSVHVSEVNVNGSPRVQISKEPYVAFILSVTLVGYTC